MKCHSNIKVTLLQYYYNTYATLLYQKALETIAVILSNVSSRRLHPNLIQIAHPFPAPPTSYNIFIPLHHLARHRLSLFPEKKILSPPPGNESRRQKAKEEEEDPSCPSNPHRSRKTKLLSSPSSSSPSRARPSAGACAEFVEQIIYDEKRTNRVGTRERVDPRVLLHFNMDYAAAVAALQWLLHSPAYSRNYL